MKKVALVTGSSEGIGYSISLRLCKEGYICFIVSRNQNKIDKAINELRKNNNFIIHGFKCDVKNKNDRKELFELIKLKYNRLDILVLNAATNPHFGNIFDITEKMFDKIYELNLKSTFFMIKEYIELMKIDKERKHIIFISSYAAFEYNITIPIYSVFKTALTPLIKLLSKELRFDNINVNGIAPGIIRTKFSKSLLNNEENVLEMMEINRIGVPEDISNLLNFIISKEANYINGSIIPIAGKPIIGL